MDSNASGPTPPPCVQAELAAALAELAPALHALGDGAWAARAWLARAFTASEFVRLTCTQHPDVLVELVRSGDLARRYADDDMARRVRAAVDADADDKTLMRALRRLRRRELLRIALRDLNDAAPLEEALRDLSRFADACIERALALIYAGAVARYGVPLAEDRKRPVAMSVLALGKLGGEELNFSSDVDLVFAYADDGETALGLSNHEFFLGVARRLIAVLNEATADGFVFRVDTRLRPFGASGPLALSFDAMESYYQTHGRDWERYALIKARACAGDVAAGALLLERLRPFVFRKYLDFGALEALRALKLKIEREVARKGMDDDIKRGAGGIRELEFVVQLVQLVRGGREPRLRRPGFLPALASAAELGVIGADAAAALREAYVFLRRLEHRVQMRQDAQTHMLPADPCARTCLAVSLGLPDAAALDAALARARAAVAAEFARALRRPQQRDGDTLALAWASPRDERAAAALSDAGFDDPASAAALLAGLREGLYGRLSQEGRARLDALMPALLHAAARKPGPDVVLARLVRLIEAIGRRPVYFSLLAESEHALAQLARLAAGADWFVDWIARHPVLLDELIDPDALHARDDAASLRAALAARLAAVAPDDLEAAMDALREFHHAQLLRTAAMETAGLLEAAAARERLSAVAETLLDAALTHARAALAARHGEPPAHGFTIVAYGKLGSRDLGYASDLDLVFLYDGAPDAMTAGPRALPAEAFFARLAQRVIHLLTTCTAAGSVYPIDTRLRPSGRAGLLVTSLEAFAAYQRERAWVWEHQALVRARAVAGDARVRARFAAVRAEVLGRERDAATLAREVLAMRARMHAAQPAHDAALFDVKHDPGGIVDIEFMVQYEVLRQAHEYRDLTRHTDVPSLLEALGTGPLGGADCAGLAETYRDYLAREQGLKLRGQAARVPREAVGERPARVRRCWERVFGTRAVITNSK